MASTRAWCKNSVSYVRCVDFGVYVLFWYFFYLFRLSRRIHIGRDSLAVEEWACLRAHEERASSSFIVPRSLSQLRHFPFVAEGCIILGGSEKRLLREISDGFTEFVSAGLKWHIASQSTSHHYCVSCTHPRVNRDGCGEELVICSWVRWGRVSSPTTIQPQYFYFPFCRHTQFWDAGKERLCPENRDFCTRNIDVGERRGDGAESTHWPDIWPLETCITGALEMKMRQEAGDVSCAVPSYVYLQLLVASYQVTSDQHHGFFHWGRKVGKYKRLGREREGCSMKDSAESTTPRPDQSSHVATPMCSSRSIFKGLREKGKQETTWRREGGREGGNCEAHEELLTPLTDGCKKKKKKKGKEKSHVCETELGNFMHSFVVILTRQYLFVSFSFLCITCTGAVSA